ncbi:MAG: DeoR/GlpR family DNA-binding transcription regulator [Spirochaetales bacterium]
MASLLIPADRRRQIYEQLKQKGVVAVSDLATLLGVSELTIRRDLDEMSRQGLIERTHGGAILNQRISVEPLYQQKDAAHKLEKEAIGKAAAMLVEDGDTLLINSGSTTLEVIRALKNRKVRIITSNLGAVSVSAEGDFECILIGGLYRPRSNSLVGALADLSLQQVYGSKAFIGVDGISFRYGLTTPILEEAEIARRMIERTPGPVIVVADHSKIGVVSNFVTAPIDKINILITDAHIEDNFRLELEKLGIRIIIAEPK